MQGTSHSTRNAAKTTPDPSGNQIQFHSPWL